MKKGIFLHSSGALMHPHLAKHRDAPISDGMAATMMFVIGFAPITALVLSLLGIFTLPVASVILVIPAILMAIVFGYYSPRFGRIMRQGFFMGLVAVTCYDCVRIPFTMLGWLDDFIPKIGGMLVGDGQHHAIIGYLWRYLGNGGGIGMAFVCTFTLLRHRFVLLDKLGGLKSALLFGCAVWACLILTLLVSSNGETVMFAITPTTLLLSLIGHLVFGFTLGHLVNRKSLKKNV